MATKTLLTRLEKIEACLDKGREKVIWVVFEGDKRPEPGQVQEKDAIIEFGFKRSCF